MRLVTEDLKTDIGLALGSAALLALTLASTANAAAMVPGTSPAAFAAPAAIPGDTCSMRLKSLQFAGTFDWKNTRTGKVEKLRFVIGTPAQGAGGTPAQGAATTSVAQIWSGKQCQASCSSVDFGKSTPPGALQTDELSMPISLDMQCRGEELGALAARVAVLWNHGSKGATTLRFGSWVDGYEQAALKIEVDHFSATSLAMDR
jgi:hypothetical protein